jgi:hypothetical protein
MRALFKTLCLASVALSLVASHNLMAEQLRLVVVRPDIITESEKQTTLTNSVALWQSLLAAELSRQSSVALLDREDLPKLAGELALMAGNTTNLTIPSGWLGADCVVLTQWQRQGDTNRLAIKILDVEKGGIEKELNRDFTDDQMEAAAGELAKELRVIGLELLSRRQIHTTVSVLDFESQSRFERGRWQEHALTRELRAFLKQQPGVLVLEREDVEALLRETRLQRGGMASAGTGLTNSWSALRYYPLVSGTIDETQPEGAPLTLRIRTQVRDLGNGRTNEFTESFPVEQWAMGISNIEQRLKTVFLLEGNGGVDDGTSAPDRATEAMALANRALQLSTWPEITNFKALLQRCPHGLLSYYELEMLFSQRHNQMILSPHTAWRQARILQACQYLKASILVDDQNPQIKLLLASLLGDSQVNEDQMAIELAEEVGWQYPEHRLVAWSYVYNHATGEQKERYLQLLIQFFPESDFARIPAQRDFEAFIQKHRTDSDLTALLDRLRPEMDRMLTETQNGIALEGEVGRLFHITQVIEQSPDGRQATFKLQTPDNQVRGTNFLEEMISKHPSQAFFLCHFWSKCWDDYLQDDPQAWYWFKRAAEVTPPGKLTKGGNNNWWDNRLKMVQRLMDRHEYKDALYYLEKIDQEDLLSGDRNLMIAHCLFELGDYQPALTAFRAFGPDNKETAEWAAKCEQKLGLPPLKSPPQIHPYLAVTNKAVWRMADIQLPPETKIHAVAADVDYLWLGLIPPMLEQDMMLSHLEESQRGWEMLERLMMMQGGLLRWNRASGETRLLTPDDGLPHRWVWSLAATPNGLWVGTLGGGLGRLNPGTGQWTVWTETNGLPLNFVRSLAADDEHLWVGMGDFNRGAVARLSIPTREWRIFLPGDYPAKTNFPSAMILSSAMPDYLKHPVVISYVPITPVTLIQVVEGLVWCVLPGRQTEGRVWTTTNGRQTEEVRANFEPHGAVIFDRTVNAWRPAIDDAPTSIVRIKDRVWLSLGGGGLASCNLQGGDLQRITSAEGLPMPAGPLCEWQGRLLIAGDGLMVLDAEHKLFEVYPFPTPGDAGLLTVVGDQVYLVRGSQILWLDLSTLDHQNPAALEPPR